MLFSKKILFSQIKEKVKAIDPKADIILFGSRARKDAKEDSDWDFLILSTLPVTNELRKLVLRNILDVELESEQTISVLIRAKNDWDSYNVTPLYKNIAKEGIAI
jgi:uncharacterized protein